MHDRLLNTHSNRVENLVDDTCYITEHYPVFTLGNRGGMENLLKSTSYLDKFKINILETQRGGNITYHGPGQLLIYPVIDIKKMGFGIKELIYRLEQLAIDICMKYDIKAVRRDINHGVWVGEKKIASIGIKVSRGVSIHGIAVNINTDLIPFSWINPCGLKGIEVTSLKEELGMELDIGKIKYFTKDVIKKRFKECFHGSC